MTLQNIAITFRKSHTLLSFYNTSCNFRKDFNITTFIFVILGVVLSDFLGIILDIYLGIIFRIILRIFFRIPKCDVNANLSANII